MDTYTVYSSMVNSPSFKQNLKNFEKITYALGSFKIPPATLKSISQQNKLFSDQMQSVIRSLQPVASSYQEMLKSMQPAFKTLAKLTSNQNFDVLTSKDFSEYLRGSSSENTNITQKFPNSQKDKYQKTDKPSKNIYRNKIFYQVQNVSISSLLVVKTRFVEWTKDQFWDTIFKMAFYGGGTWVIYHIKSFLELIQNYINAH